MKHFFLLACLLTTAAVTANVKVDIDRHGRRVQVDGFLMEWSPRTAHQWGDSVWSWDAMNTPEGIAGYFSSGTQRVCSTWVFVIDPQVEGTEFEIRIPERMNSDFYSVDEQRYDSLGALTIEWLIPWSALNQDLEKAYVISMRAVSGCDDALVPLLLTGARQKATGFVTPGMISKGLLIILLLVVYIYVRKKIMKKAKAART